MSIRPLDHTLDAHIRSRIDQKTKPPGSLGQLETIARQVALIQQTETPALTNPYLLVFAADHGVTADGVSAYPAVVTYQMVLNFLAGGAAINVFCQQHGLNLLICDVGVNGQFDEQAGASSQFIKYKIRAGTRNLRIEPAMALAETEAALDSGRTIVNGVNHRGSNVIGFGEMGIGNTSSAALLMHRFTGLPLEACVGRGTGLDDKQVLHKLTILQEAARNHTSLTDPLAILTALGGYEIAAITGGMLQAAELGMVILVDGFIATAALLVAQALDPAVLEYCIFCHQSDESGHRLMLEYLGATPLLQLGMRLGEGTGCALAYPLIQSAVAMLNDMASFDSLPQ